MQVLIFNDDYISFVSPIFMYLLLNISSLQEATTRQGILLCVLVFLLYLSRVVYNLIAVAVPHDLSSFGYGWINVSDEVHRVMNEVKFLI